MPRSTAGACARTRSIASITPRTSSWSAPGALDHIEWFQGIRTLTTAGSNYYIQEDLHPDYLAQLALRSCIRQAYNGGTPRGGTCALSGTGTDSHGDPKMTLS